MCCKSVYVPYSELKKELEQKLKELAQIEGALGGKSPAAKQSEFFGSYRTNSLRIYLKGKTTVLWFPQHFFPFSVIEVIAILRQKGNVIADNTEEYLARITGKTIGALI